MKDFMSPSPSTNLQRYKSLINSYINRELYHRVHGTEQEKTYNVVFMKIYLDRGIPILRFMEK